MPNKIPLQIYISERIFSFCSVVSSYRREFSQICQNSGRSCSYYCVVVIFGCILIAYAVGVRSYMYLIIFLCIMHCTVLCVRTSWQNHKCTTWLVEVVLSLRGMFNERITLKFSCNCIFFQLRTLSCKSFITDWIQWIV